MSRAKHTCPTCKHSFRGREAAAMANADGVICRGDTHEILSGGKRNTIGGALVMSGDEARLEQLERVIREHVGGFVEVGNALREIRETRSYKTRGFKTFEAYCREQWDMGRRRAYELIDGAAVVCAMAHKKLPPITTERHARELAKLPAEQQAAAWREAVETAPGGKVTAKHVKSVVAPLLPPKPTPKPAPWDDDAAVVDLDLAIEKRLASWPVERLISFEESLRSWLRRAAAKRGGAE